jgi:hypothetical protein
MRRSCGREKCLCAAGISFASQIENVGRQSDGAGGAGEGGHNGEGGILEGCN